MTFLRVCSGSIPDSYDIYQYLNLVRYSIFDTRYFRRRPKCNFVDICRGYLKQLRHVHLLFSKKKFVMKHSGKNEIPNVFFENPTFVSKIRFFPENPIFFLENPIFFPKIRRKNLENIIFFPKIYEIQGFVLVHILLFENIRNPVFGHFPSFPASSFMPRVTYFQYLTQCGVKPGLYSVRRSTQTELRKRIYADTRVMAFILLRRSPHMYAYCRSVYTRHLRDPYGVDWHW